MSISKLLTVLTLCGSLGACASFEQAPASNNTGSTAIALAETAGAVSQSLQSLDANQQAANPPQAISAQPAAATYGLQMPVSIDWNGPIGPFVTKITELSGYSIKTLGTPPPIPVLIAIHSKTTPVADVLRDAGFQAGNHASIVVYPTTRVVELRYNDDGDV